MNLYLEGVTLRIDCSVVNDPAPQTPQERIDFVQDAISEVNNRLGKGTGILLIPDKGQVVDRQIRVEQ
jgi:hypothetical protein